MKNYSIYIIGSLFLIIGVSLGWLLKPVNKVEDHSQHEHELNASAQAGSEDEIWTCSMHPQIRQNEPGICPICEMDLIPLDNSMGSDDPTILKMSNASAALAQIETFTIGGGVANGRQDDENASAFNVDGTIEMDERTVKSQTAHVNGRIEEMSITFEGQYVKSGQKIASIYSTELLAASQELLTAAKFNDRVEGLTASAKQKLKNWKITDSQIESIINSGQPMETIDIYADHSGYVLKRNLSQGDYVKQGQSLYNIGSTSNLWLIFNVFESDLSNVKIGNKVTFTTPSLPNEEFNARISYLNPLLNSKSRTAVVRAEFNNKGNKLKPGMLLNGQISKTSNKSTQSATGPLSIPNSAILWTGKRSVVYVQVQETDIPTFEFREVTIGDRSSNYSTISDGLELGETVVTNGAFAIDAAAQLKNNASMMNRNVTIKKPDQAVVQANYVESTPQQFKQQLDELLVKYISLKDALVETNIEATASATASFLSEVSNVDMSLVKGDAHMYWMEQLSALKAHSDKIVNSGDIEEQRSQFDFLSQAMINTIKAFGTNDKVYYVLFCPMVNDNQGADWISTEKQIRNPYFGDKMMKCGSVKLELH